ncbi:MAG: Hint domain-containing protein [Acidocella sp.]
MRLFQSDGADRMSGTVSAPSTGGDITSLITADGGADNIALQGGNYVINLPAGATTYTGVISGAGTLTINSPNGAGTLVLTQTPTYTLPTAEQTQAVSSYFYTFADVEYDGLWGANGLWKGWVYVVNNPDPASLTIGTGTTLQLGNASASGVTINNDIVDNGTLLLAEAYDTGLITIGGTISGSGGVTVVSGGYNGGIRLYGVNTFTGPSLYLEDGANIGTDHEYGSTPDTSFIFIDTSYLPTVPVPSTGEPGYVDVTQNIWEDRYENDINLDDHSGLTELSGVYSYSDSGNESAPSLTNAALNYTCMPKNYSERGVNVEGSVVQFGDGTTSTMFINGNAYNSYINLHSNGILGFDYIGTTTLNTAIGGGQYLASLSTPGVGDVVIRGNSSNANHVIFTQAEFYNGLTQIDAGTVLQLGDGTTGNASGTAGAIGYYNSSGGNSSLLTADTANGASTDSITDNDLLIVDNTTGAVDGITTVSLSNISGVGGLEQIGDLALTLLENTDYTGATTIGGDSTLYIGVNSSGVAGSIADSSGVALTGAGAVLDISQAGNQTIQDLVGVAGSTVALGSGALTLGTADSTEFDGSITDGGLAGGTGGSLIKQGSGVLTLGGDNGYTGGTVIDAGALIGSVESFGTGSIVNDATLVINQDSAGTLSNALSGNGDLILAGAGDITLTGMTSYSGAISIKAGSLTFSGVTTAIAGQVFGGGTLVIAGGASVTLDANPTAAISFVAAPAGQANTLILPASGAPLGNIMNLAPSDVIEFATDSTDTTIIWTETSPGVYALYGVQTDGTKDLLINAVSFAQNTDGVSYVPSDFSTSTADGSLVVSAASADALCYLRGTHILTLRGEVPVEDLAIGDEVVTWRGGVQPVKWIGRQSYAARFIARNFEQIPVNISACALGPNLPRRDLFVSPGHSMLLGQTLVLAKSLVNGITVTQEEMPETVEYYNIELETHDCVLVEGAWGETFADGPGLREHFNNAASFWALYPDFEAPDEVTVCAPRPLSGPGLDAALRPVVARAAFRRRPGQLRGFVDIISRNGLVEGWAQDMDHPYLPVPLEVLFRDEVIATVLACNYRDDLAAAKIGRGRCGFSVETGRTIDPQDAGLVRVRREAGQADLLFSADLAGSMAGATATVCASAQWSKCRPLGLHRVLRSAGHTHQPAR